VTGPVKRNDSPAQAAGAVQRWSNVKGDGFVNYVQLESAIRERSHSDVVEMVKKYALSAIAEGRSALRAVRHPLGFACLPIHRVERMGACVHVWPRKRIAPTITTSPFHCHSWDLLSYVLYGSVGNQLVDVTPGSTYKAFEVRGGGGVDHLVANGRQYDARGHAPEYWSAGEYYELAAGKFHASTMVDDTEAATIVLGFHNPARSDVTLGALDTPDHQVTRRLSGAADTARIAKRAIARLSEERERVPALAVA
jgi:hypothetical protein